MGRPVLKVKGYSSEEIKALIRRDERYTIGVRLYAVLQVSLGQPSRNLEELYQTSFKQITNWVHRFEQEGIDGLRDKPGRGRKPLLSAEQSGELLRLMLHESPTDHGYNTETWTGPILIDWIRKSYGIEYRKAQIYNIIKQLGLSYQKAKGFYPEADENAQEEFKDGLKKTPGKSG
ncbi:Transposase [Lunatimonas lonarensis]|uniref:Transposase n=1 Tax=Lunatimonas lonarensis TaxID=1232681 RepID=R7ZL54_9BACT|nr:IS630 family transposase [Lunatimonas lonarensis]EON74802.1 Transposase [Lunatimonas lonarensis]